MRLGQTRHACPTSDTATSDISRNTWHLLVALLELNVLIPGPERVGIREEAVWVASVRRILELQRDDFARCIHGVMALCAHLDDQLMARYAGTAKQRTPAKGKS